MGRKDGRRGTAAPGSATANVVHHAGQPRRVAWIGLALALAVVAGIGWWTMQPDSQHASTSDVPDSRKAVAGFVGSESCAACHQAQHAAWKKSQHAGAMQHASADTVRGNFDDATYTFDGVTSKFFKRDGKHFVRTDGPDGKLADFEVRYTFGLEPLQQYLVELPGGRLQALAVTWDTRPADAGGQRWFRQYPDEKLDFRDELHWTQRSQNWNFMCADCHSTNVRKGYDAARDAFATQWSEISVGCESCHGPGSAHLAVGEGQAVVRSGEGTDGRARRTARRRVADRSRERQREAHAGAPERPRDRGLRSLPCAPRADCRRLAGRAPR